MPEEDLDKIVKLKELLDAGLITKEDFNKQKTRILSGLGTASRAAPGRAKAGRAASSVQEEKGPSFIGSVRKHGLSEALREALGFVD